MRSVAVVTGLSGVLGLLLCSFGADAAGKSASANFILRCSGCHGLRGDGAPEVGIPQFRNFVGAFAGDPAGRTYVVRVPGVSNSGLNDAEIADVINYVMKTWGGTSLPSSFVPFTEQEVVTRRALPVADVVSLRREVVQHLKLSGIATAEYPWP
jgi:hypothetical protein